MTREEQIIDAAEKFSWGRGFRTDATYAGFLEGVKWADANPKPLIEYKSDAGPEPEKKDEK